LSCAPSLPDSLPVIGRSPKSDRVIYAFGHGHLGLTQSAGMAELVAAIVARRF
jgi:D-amino-acid dehydrogenase